MVSLQNSGNAEIYRRTYIASDNYAPLENSPVKVNDDIAGVLEKDPSVATLNNGNYVIAWTDKDGSGDGVKAAVFDSKHNRIGSEFRVNSVTTSHQK